MTPGVAPLFSTPVLFSVIAPTADAAADRAVVQHQGVPAASEKAGSTFAGANVHVNTENVDGCSNAVQKSYDQSSWWFWWVIEPCPTNTN